MTPADEIVGRYKERKRDRHPVLERMREVRDHYNGDVVVPLPELDKAEKPAVANLLAEGVDQTSMRVSSTLPNIWCPPLNARKREGVRSIEYANVRRMGIAAWWEFSRIRAILRRRARFLVAYGEAPIHIRPDFEAGVPRWHLRHPLSTFPAPQDEFDMSEPEDCIFSFTRNLQWLQRKYPDSLAGLWKGHDPKPDDRFELLEYVDGEETVMLVLGKEEKHHTFEYEASRKFAELERFPNRAGICPVVTADRVTLDRICGQFNQIMGMYQAQARLMALDLIAVEKAVFPDLAIIGNNGQTPQLVGDEWMDGRTGEINIIHNGDVKAVNQAPGFKTGEAMDRLERGVRSAGITAQMTGEAPSGIRTGRASEITMSATIDFRIQEYQETLALSLERENRRAIAIAKGYFGSRSKSFHVSLPKAKGPVDYVPNKHFETDENKVEYPMPGADVNAAVIGVAQRVGSGLMSRRAGMWADPLIDDPEHMYDEVTGEELERATLDSIKQQAAQGAIPPGDMARIDQLVREDNKPLYEAIQIAQEEAQERQAEELDEGDPGLEPGLAQPGMGAEGSPSIPEPSPSQSNLAGLLYRLRQPASEAGGAAPPTAQGASS